MMQVDRIVHRDRDILGGTTSFSFWPMRVLLDEQLPMGLSAELRGHIVDTVGGRSWAGIKNGELLHRMKGY